MSIIEFHKLLIHHENKNLAITSWQRLTYAERWHRAAATRKQKTYLKVGFQDVVRNATDAHEKRNALKDSTYCVRCAIHVHALHISVFWLRCVACVAYDSLESACRPMKMDVKVDFQTAVRIQHTQVTWRRSLQIKQEVWPRVRTWYAPAIR